MKRRIFLSIALVLSVLTIFNLAANAQQQSKIYVADSGVVMLGPNQKLRAVVATANDDQVVPVKVRRCLFAAADDGSLSVVSGNISPYKALTSNEALFFDVFGGNSSIAAVRLRVGSKKPGIVVTFQIINTVSGEIQTLLVSAITANDDWESPVV